MTAVLYILPFGRSLAWPLVLISTLAHELGHGLTASLLGGTFHSLRMWSDASGVAAWSGNFGRAETAAVAAAGLVGPAFAAFVLLTLGRDARRAPPVLMVLGTALVLITAVWVRNLFGVTFVLALAGALWGVALKARAIAQTVLVFLAVELALSVFSRSDYLFTPVALTSTGFMPSDVAVMADSLFLPYWFWGAACGLLSVALLVLGVRVFFRRRARAGAATSALMR